MTNFVDCGECRTQGCPAGGCRNSAAPAPAEKPAADADLVLSFRRTGLTASEAFSAARGLAEVQASEKAQRPASAPVRAFRLTLALEADTRDDLARALSNLADRVDRDEVTTGVWGSPSDGAIYELLHDPAMTHDAYHAALREYLDGLREKDAIRGASKRTARRTSKDPFPL